MMIGGYQILDMLNVNLLTTATSVVKGAYEALEGNYYKPVLVSNLKIAGSKVGGFYTLPYISSDDYVIKVAIGDIEYTITIDSDDVVTLAQVVQD